MTTLVITDLHAELTSTLQQSRTAAVPTGFALLSSTSPTATMKDSSDPKHPILTLHATGVVGITTANDALAPAKFTGKAATDIETSLAALPGVASVSAIVKP